MTGIYALTLSNNTTWFLSAGDAGAAPAVAEVAAAMSLAPVPDREVVDAARLVEVFLDAPSGGSAGLACVLPQPKDPAEAAFVRCFHTGLAFARLMQQGGALLLHAALAVYQPAGEGPRGVLFSAPGGTGKSTTSRRLPAPWRSLSDDACLVVPVDGQYRAHPWPTWSRYLNTESPGERWPAAESAPLSAIAFLKQAPEDSLEPVGAGQAASLLAESARQINFWDLQIPPAGRPGFRLQRFDAVCALAKTVPAYLLQLSLEGQFWREVEGALA